jgi:diaminopimelate decarboxylase
MNRLALFPDTTTINKHSLSIAGCDLADLADQYGTPLYLYDRATLDNALLGYQKALVDMYPGSSSLTYAGKAYLCIAIAEWTQQHDMMVDCTGLGEIAISVIAGVPRERLIVHGVNKSAADLLASCENAGVIVVDNLAELQHLVELSHNKRIPEIWLRFQPGLAVDTHAYTQTGQVGSKFGMDGGQIVQAAHICRKNDLTLKGLHFHQGSQFHDPAPLIPAIKRALDVAAEIEFGDDWILSPGGGWGVVYHDDELPQPDVINYVKPITQIVVQGCKDRSLPLPLLNLEPGRSLVGRAGVALYRVGVVKRVANRVWALLDGGLADNPRPALYRTRYTALPVREPERPVQEPVWFAGPYCESGDVLIEDLPFQEIREGDLVAVPVSGAYQLSMSSNYNGARRPAVIWLEGGQAQVIQERESPESLFVRDHRLVKPSRTG